MKRSPLVSSPVQRLAAWLCLISMAVQTVTPLGMALAAPSILARPGAGVSRLPLDVMTFGAPGFGELEEAVNIANGNVALETADLAYNSVLGSQDEQTNSVGKSGWNFAPRLRLQGFTGTIPSQSENLITQPDLRSGEYNGYFVKPAITTFNRFQSKDGGCGADVSGFLRIEPSSLSSGRYQVSLEARTASGELNVSYGLNDYKTVTAKINTQYQSLSQEFVLNAGDVEYGNGQASRLFEIREDTKTNPAWEIGNLAVRRFDSVTKTWGDNLVAEQDVRSDYWSGYCGPKDTEPFYRLATTDYNNTNLPYSGLIFEQATAKASGRYRVMVEARTKSGQLGVRFGLDDHSVTQATLTPEWQTLSVDATILDSTDYDARRLFQVLEDTPNNAQWELKNPRVYRYTTGIASGATRYFLGSGDGSGTTFNLQSRGTINWSEVPSWIRRYRDVPNAQLYSIVQEAGLKSSGEWLALVASGAGAVAHYYVSDGTRYTFNGDGEYVDYIQSLHQQLRSAEQGDPEGLTGPKTDYVYETPASGRISKVQDEWGRSTTYKWTVHDGESVLTRICYLSNTSTSAEACERSVGLQYETVKPAGRPDLSQRVVTWISYFGPDGRGGANLDRWLDFSYKEVQVNGTPKIVLAGTRKATLGTWGPETVTDYAYDAQGRLQTYTTTGEPSTSYDYSGVSETYKGPLVSVTQTPASGLAKVTKYHFDNAGQLRQKDVTDKNPNTAASRTLTWKYAYYTGLNGLTLRGNLGLIQDPSGMVTHLVYDARGNMIREATYADQGLWTGEIKLPVRVTIEPDFSSPQSTAPWVTASEGEFTVRARVSRDLLARGVKWSFSLPGGTETPVTASSNLKLKGSGLPAAQSDGSYTVEATFVAPAQQTSVKVIARSVTDTTATGYHDLNVSSRIQSVTIRNLSGGNGKSVDKVIVAPGCLMLRNGIDGFDGGCQTQTPPLTVDVKLADWVPANDPKISQYKAVTFQRTGFYGLSYGAAPTPTVTATGQVAVQWSDAAAAQDASVTVRATTAEGKVSDDVRINLGYFGIQKVTTEEDGKGNWNTFVNSEAMRFQYAVKLVNAPFSSMPANGITFRSSRTDVADFRADAPGCLSTGFWPSNAGTQAFTVSAYVTSFPSVTAGPPLSVTLYPRSFSDSFWGTRYDEVDCPNNWSRRGGTLNFTAPNPQSGNLSQQGVGSSSIIVPDTKTYGVLGSAANPDIPIDLTTDLAVNPSGWDQYLQATISAYDTDNRPTQVTESGLKGSASKNVTHTYTYSPAFSSTVSNQTFSATQVTEKKTYWGEVNETNRRRTSKLNQDKMGLLQSQSLAWASKSRSTNYTYYPASPLTEVDIVVPDSPGSAINYGTSKARQYGDQVKSAVITTSDGATALTPRSVTQKTYTYKYDGLGHTAETLTSGQSAGAAGGAVKSYAVASGAVTLEFGTHSVQRAYNGFDQMVWERTQIDSAVARESGWTYLDNGELVNAWSGTPKNLTTYSYFGAGEADVGRIQQVTSGVGDGTWSPSSAVAVTQVHSLTKFTYDAYGRKATEATLQPTGNDQYFTTTYDYDTLDRPVKLKMPDGSVITTGYDVSGAQATLDEPKVTTNWTRSRPAAESYRLVLTETRTPKAGFGQGMTVTTLHDEFDQPIQITTSATTINSAPEDNTTTLKYDPEGRVTVEIGPKLRTKSDGNSQWFVDARRPATVHEYDGLGRLTKSTQALYSVVNGTTGLTMAASDSAVTSTRYDNFDQPVEQTDANGYVTQSSYDALGQVFRVARQVWKPSASTGTSTPNEQTVTGFTANQQAVGWTAFDAEGRPTQAVDPLGQSSRRVYDLLGNVVADVDARGYAVRRNTYTPDGLLQGRYEPKVGAGTSAKDWTSAISTNAFQLNEWLEYGKTAVPISSTRATMDSVPVGDATLGTVTGGAKTTFTLNWQGKPTVATLPDGTTTEQDYDAQGNVTRRKDPAGFVITSTYDASNSKLSETHLVRTGTAAVTDQDAGLSGGLKNTFTYDAFGNMTESSERGLKTRFEYNSLGQVIAESRPSTGTDLTKYKYKKYAYRLDGAKMAETGYSYLGNDLETKQQQSGGLLASSTAVTFTEGHLSVYQRDPGGQVQREVSLGYFGPPVGSLDSAALLREEKSVEYAYSGLGQRVYRNFNGHKDIYLNQRHPTMGAFLAYPNGGNSTFASPYPFQNTDPVTRQFTYWKFDLNGRLKAKEDQVDVLDGTGATQRLALNKFSYDYSPTGQQTRAWRSVEVKVPRLPNPSITLNVDPLLAGTTGDVTSEYDERDQLAVTRVSDRSVTGLNGLETAPTTPQRVTRHKYYADGSKATIEVEGQGTVTTLYDVRGRPASVVDSNGAQRPASGVGTGEQDRRAPDITAEARYAARGKAITTTAYGSTGATTVTLAWDASPAGSACTIATTTTPTLAGLPYKQTRTNSCDNSRPWSERVQKYNSLGLMVQDTSKGGGTYVAQGTNANPATPTTAWTNTAQSIVYNEDSTLKSATYQATQTVKGYSYEQSVERKQPVRTQDPAFPNDPTKTILVNMPFVPPQYDTVTRQVADQTNSSVDVRTNDYNTDGALKQEIEEHQVTGTSFQSGQMGGTRTTSDYALDSRGNRLSTTSAVTGLGGMSAGNGSGSYNGYIKRYDADDQVALYFRYDPATKQGAYSDFRYDPEGRQVLTSNAGYRHDASGYIVARDYDSHYLSGGDLQMVRKRQGRLGQGPPSMAVSFLWWTITPASDGRFDTYTANNQIQDLTYTGADALTDTVSWEALKLFEAVPDSATTVFEAPTPSISTRLGVEPGDILAPAGADTPLMPVAPSDILPSTLPGVTPPAPDQGQQPAGTIAVQGALATVGSLDTPPAQVSTLDAPVADQASPVGAVTPASTPELQAPQNVLPAVAGGVNVLDVSTPGDPARPVVPAAPDIGEIQAPGAVPIPPISAAPSDGLAGIQPPGQITVNVPPVGLDSAPLLPPPGTPETQDVKPFDEKVYTYEEYLDRMIEYGDSLAAAQAKALKKNDTELGNQIGHELKKTYALIKDAILTKAATTGWSAADPGLVLLRSLLDDSSVLADAETRIGFLEGLGLAVTGDSITSAKLDALRAIDVKLKKCIAGDREQQCGKNYYANKNDPSDSYRRSDNYAYMVENDISLWLGAGVASLDRQWQADRTKGLIEFGLNVGSNFIPGTVIARIGGKAIRSFPALMRAARAYSAGTAALTAKLTAARLQVAAKLVKNGCKFSPNSFAFTTPVHTLTGLAAIGSLTTGTPVLAFNEQTGENGYFPITAVHKNVDPDITYLTITDPEQGDKTEFIETTPEHPFYVQEQVDSTARPAPQGHEELNTHWVGAGHLQIGDKIKQADGTVGVIANIITVQQTQEMFNLTVDTAHTYYVGEQGWLVHNCDVYYPFDIVRYDTDLVQLNALRIARGLPRLEKHHGILDVWAKNNVPGYVGKEAPTIVLTDAQHQATKNWFNQWRIRETGSLTGRVDWAAMGPREAQEMANQMFSAAGIPQKVTDQYVKNFTRYIYGK